MTHFGAYFQDPLRELARVLDWLQLEVPETQLLDAIATIRPSLRHSSFDAEMLSRYEAGSDVTDLYAALRAEAQWNDAVASPRDQASPTEERGSVAGGSRDGGEGRMGTPADIGNAVVLLCSEQAGWITGQTIYADGGASLMDTVFPLEIQGAAAPAPVAAGAVG